MRSIDIMLVSTSTSVRTIKPSEIGTFSANVTANPTQPASIRSLLIAECTANTATPSVISELVHSVRTLSHQRVTNLA